MQLTELELELNERKVRIKQNEKSFRQKKPLILNRTKKRQIKT